MFFRLSSYTVTVLTLVFLIQSRVGTTATEENTVEQDLPEHRGLSAELDYFDFVARATAADILKDDSSEKPEQLELVQHRAVVETVRQEPASVLAAEKVTEVVKKEVVPEQDNVVPTQENQWDKLRAKDFWELIDVGSYLTILFPDPFQAYVFSGLLVWLLSALILLRREWKKSSRIVLDVYLQQGAEAIQLVEDRYKDQLNLPGEYSLLA